MRVIFKQVFFSWCKIIRGCRIENRNISAVNRQRFLIGWREPKLKRPLRQRAKDRKQCYMTFERNVVKKTVEYKPRRCEDSRKLLPPCWDELQKRGLTRKAVKTKQWTSTVRTTIETGKIIQGLCQPSLSPQHILFLFV